MGVPKPDVDCLFICVGQLAIDGYASQGIALPIRLVLAPNKKTHFRPPR
jgi:hypothetical protein